MQIFDAERKWFSPKWIKVISIILKSFLTLVITGTFIFFSIMIYLIVQDYFYNESEDEFNENGNLIMKID
ncbi:hypothetical protein [Virgibacillus necropolis]|uniref:Uncharacterized protein n=1 Tax=Virgibacillus necropolis TaxID=163877 RepID=A0A221M854_9BACI|nr:hypothetical protein [Virgibacillus necropolis]ASN03833.1 hypothetical protein CFK40_01855 [Virgibacillus necropolis]